MIGGLIFKKKFFLSTLIIFFGLVFVFSVLQNSVMRVSADSWPLIVNINHMDFGVVFPQETLQKTFTVSLDPEYPHEVNYAITQNPKPLPVDYEGDGADPENPGYYRNLCPYLEKISADDGEGDTEESAHLFPETDEMDAWIVAFDVPCIEGYVGQDFEGTPVPNSGDYGCDVGVEFLEEVGGGEDDGDNGDDGKDENGNDGTYTASSSGGGGGGGPTGLIIYNESSEVFTESITVSWFTNKKSTSRVIYDIVPHPDSELGSAPNYGYAFSTPEYDTPAVLEGVVPFHEVEISGLEPGVTYYYRCVSHASPETIGKEYSFTAEGLAPEPPDVPGETPPGAPEGPGLPDSEEPRGLLPEPEAEGPAEGLAYAPPAAGEPVPPASDLEPAEELTPEEELEKLEEKIEELEKKLEEGELTAEVKPGFLAGTMLPALKYLTEPLFWLLLLLALLALYFLIFYYRKERKKEDKDQQGHIKF